MLLYKQMNRNTFEQITAKVHNERYSARHSWKNMILRCTNPACLGYKNYGARGISVCSDWLKFDNFYRDMGGRPTELTLERINNKKGYFLSNCKWATRKEQQNNTRRLKLFLALGPGEQIEASRYQSGFADKWSLARCSISSCLHNCKRYQSHKGWIFDLLIPVEEYLANV